MSLTMLKPISKASTLKLLIKSLRARSAASFSPRIPLDAWDSHMHVTDPASFPIASSATYTPHMAPLSEALKNAARLSLPNLVFVQPSTYGTDNGCLLNSLAHVTPARGRGVIVFDVNQTGLDQLKRWHNLGVRGVRVNLKSVKSEITPEELRKLLKQYIDAIRPLKTWALQLFIDMAIIPQLEPVVAELDGSVKIVIDHLGSPTEVKSNLYDMPGWEDLVKMMRNSNIFVKLSAPYRISDDPQYNDLEALTKELLSSRGGNGVVFASDWPHTRYEGVDVSPWIERCLEWCGNDTPAKNKVFRDNAKALWDVD